MESLSVLPFPVNGDPAERQKDLMAFLSRLVEKIGPVSVAVNITVSVQAESEQPQASRSVRATRKISELRGAERRLYDVMTVQPKTAKKIMRESGLCSNSSNRQHLTNMARAGLIHHGPDGWAKFESDYVEGLPFVPSPFQAGILKVLDGKAMRTDALGAAVGDRSRLFKDNGIAELREKGLVAHHPRLGFFRPDAPPAELKAVYVPSDIGQEILQVLEGKAMRTDALALAVGGDRSRVHKANALPELRAHGLVEHHPRLGFYRPDAPPPELTTDPCT